VPSISVVEAPYVWRDAAHLQKAMSGPVGQKFNDTLVKARGMRIWEPRTTARATSRRLEGGEVACRHGGLKLRVPENDVFKAMAELGAKPTPMNFGELYLALKQNVVDGQENPLPTIKSGKFDEVQKYLVLSGHIITPRLVVVNEAFWQGCRPPTASFSRTRSAPASPGRTRSSRSRRSRWSTPSARGHDRDHARCQRIPRTGARQGAEDVRVEVGRRHVRGDPAIK